jgi:hypothetical protein
MWGDRGVKSSSHVSSPIRASSAFTTPSPIGTSEGRSEGEGCCRGAKEKQKAEAEENDDNYDEYYDEYYEYYEYYDEDALTHPAAATV